MKFSLSCKFVLAKGFYGYVRYEPLSFDQVCFINADTADVIMRIVRLMFAFVKKIQVS